MIKKIFITLAVFILWLYISCNTDPVSSNENKNNAPVARFIFFPEFGDTSTIFEFDASSSYDKEDSLSALKMRWDWDTDGNWDTGYLSTKKISHQFDKNGIKNISLEVTDTDGLSDTTVNNIFLSITNTVPVADFTVLPDSGNTDTIFEFDASSSHDNEDASNALLVRWDWENDGFWDTHYSLNKIENHQYSGSGLKSVKLKIRDTGGLTNTIIKQIRITDTYTSPSAFFTINPSEGNTETLYEFDASGSSDKEDTIDSLKIRWDWENDGVWDTGYLYDKKNYHQFPQVGEYTTKMQIIDTDNLTDSITISFYVSMPTATVTDIDSNIYKTVKIGEQWWMAENLKVTHYRNYDHIIHAQDDTQWADTDSGAWCAFSNDDANVAVYGLIYNWYAVHDTRNIAPPGWHVATDQDWKKLEVYLGMSQVEADNKNWRGTNEGGKLKEKGTTLWSSPNTGATNETGFSARPGGIRGYVGYFEMKRTQGTWWTSSEDGASAYIRMLINLESRIYRASYIKEAGIYVRCVKD